MLDEKSIDIYSSRDKIREQLISLSKQYLQLENFDFNKSSYLSYIINMLASLDANLMYYISSVYREQFLTKAMQRESVLNLANIIGYKPLFAIPAKCPILMDIPLNTGEGTTRIIEFLGRNNDETLIDNPEDRPAFRVYSTDGIQFSLENTIIVTINPQNIVTVKQQMFLSNSGSVNVGWKTIEHRISNGNIQFIADFVQLIDVSETFTIPELLPNEFHTITYNFNKYGGSIADIDLFTVKTLSNGVVDQWVRKESIFGIGPDEQAFTYRETEKGITVSFGNGVIGKQPKKGTNVIVTVGITRGSKGNVISGNITRSDNARMLMTNTNGVSSSKFVNVRVINREPSQFGVDAPTIDEVRANAINSVSANSRLVSQRDFQNADIIIQSLPIKNVFQVLKRSDLKRNEITLFTELIYDNVVVPTRNTNLTISNNDIDVEDTIHQIKTESEVSIDGESYLTLFDIYLNKYTNEVSYYYYITETQLPVNTINLTDSVEPTKIFPIFSYYATDRTSNPEQLKVELHCNVVDNTSNYRCDLIVDFPNINGESTFTLYDTTATIPTSVKSVKIFSTHPDPGQTQDTYIDLSYVPTGELMEFNFKIYKIDGDDEIELNRSSNKVIIKKDLSDFMYSQVNPTGDSYVIYDVPVVKKDYYENLINKNLFTSSVMQKIVDFDIYDFKMVTDFVNLKFANTTGYSTNMKYRTINRAPVIDINPTDEPPRTVGARYAVSDVNNPWSRSSQYPTITSGGFIAYFANSRWNFEYLKVNDMFFVNNLPGRSEPVKMIYTGIEIVEPKFTIPIKIRLVIIPSDSLTTTVQLLIRTIKDTLVTKLGPFFGYNKSLLRSVIIQTVQSVPGVEHAELLEPSFNIKFEQDPYKNMTQEELLRYTPELIFFSTDDIIIEVKE